MTDTPAKPTPLTPAQRTALALEALADAGHRIASALERLSPPAPPNVSLDGPRGNPVVKFSPREWRGENFKGRTYSNCPAEFLELLAHALDEMNAEQTNPKFRHFGRLDAACARGWCERIRSGWKPATTSSSGARLAAPPPPAARPVAPPPAAAPRPSAALPASATAPANYPPEWDDLPGTDGADELEEIK